MVNKPTFQLHLMICEILETRDYIYTHIKDNMSNIENINVTVFKNDVLIQNFHTQLFSKKSGQVYYYDISPFLLITQLRHQETEETNCCNFETGMFSQFCSRQDFSCSMVQGLFFLRFIMHQAFSVCDKVTMRVGQFSTKTLFTKEKSCGFVLLK